VRNQVLRSLTPGAPPVRGIVYEAVPTDKHLLDFNLFFGCSEEPSKLIDNIHLVNEHMDTFGNTAPSSASPMREWIFRDPVHLTSTCATPARRPRRGSNRWEALRALPALKERAAAPSIGQPGVPCTSTRTQRPSRDVRFDADFERFGCSTRASQRRGDGQVRRALAD
jgi:hypothetical protein